MAITNVKEINKENMYTREQLLRLKKFKGKYLDVYPHHYVFWKDGVGYETVYEVRGMTTQIRENYQSVEEILS